MTLFLQSANLSRNNYSICRKREIIMVKNLDRLPLCNLLCSLFSYPDEDLLRQLGALCSADLSVPGLALPPTIDLRNQNLESLQTGYTSLFISRLGGVPAPPYGSVYLDNNRLMGASTRQVEHVYANEGLSVQGAGEPADFLPTELEFLYYLIEQESESREDDTVKVQALRSKQATFLQQFLLPWIPEFCLRIQQDAQAHPLYVWASRLLSDFIHQENQRFQDS